MRTSSDSHGPPRVGRWVLAAAASCLVAAPLAAQSLHGAPGTIERQNAAAEAHDFTFLDTPAEVYKFVEQLVVTSLTRPTTRQPRNASSRSVHPTGMAVDLRRSGKDSCRQWLESVLLLLEGQGVIEAVREKRPPHYHIAVFPKPYRAYVDSLVALGGDGGGGDGPTPGRVARYKVRRGDTLWMIARLHDTTIQGIRAENHLRGSRIYPGQVLALPESRASD